MRKKEDVRTKMKVKNKEKIENKKNSEEYIEDITSQINNIQILSNQDIEKLFTPLKDKKTQEKDFFSFLEAMIIHISNLIKKEKMGNEYIDKHMGKLSAREILSNGKIFYMNPCLDLVMVTLEGLKRSGIENIQLVIDELECPWNIYKLHFGIEILHQEEIYYIDYRTNNDVYLGKGNFKSKYQYKGESIINTIKINAQEISSDDNIHNLIEKWLLQFKNFNSRILTLLKEKLKHDNTPEQYERFRAQNNEKVKIYREQ